MRTPSKPLLLAALAAGSAAPQLAHGGGFEFPGNGTEALGRGGAFTAKADTPLALEYNVAGLAQQRGTRLLFDSNLQLDSLSFQRAGAYPLATDQAAKPFYAPIFAVTTDFGYFDRWTFALGAFGPSSIGKRNYPLAADGSGPARYDLISSNLLTLFPTLAAGFHAHKFLDIGLALQLSYSTFELSNASFVSANATPEGTCRMRPEDPRCDTRTEVSVKSSINPLLAIGLLLHPHENVDVGLHIRSGANLGARPIEATGELKAVTSNGTEFGPVDATFLANLPWIFRVGARYAFMKGEREAGDIELDATYEAWSLSEGEGSRLQAPSPLAPNDETKALDILLVHHYHDTYSLRLGGAFNQPIGPAQLTLRAGLFYDSSATDSAFTRLDFNTLPKLGATFGLGATVRGITLNFAYAYIHGFERTVTDGQLMAIDGGTGKPVVDAVGNIAPAVNNGTYSGQVHTVSLGLLVQFDALIKGAAWKRRSRHYP